MDLALLDNAVQPLHVERSDGHTSTADLRWWLGDSRARPPVELSALELIEEGSVLDVGCATGRHLKLLQARGLAVYGIDTCPSAVAIARRGGVNCKVADVWRFNTDRRFRTVMALGGNLGIAGRSGRLGSYLRLLSSFLDHGGRILLSSVDWRRSASRHAEFVTRQKEEGRYPGDVRLRLRYGDAVSAWFEWLWADLDLLRNQADAVGHRIGRVMQWEHRYVAEILKEAV